MDTIGNSSYQICRTCMIQDQSLLSIFECSDTPLSIYEMLTTTIPQLQTLNEDNLPQQICAACINKLNIAYEFHQMCINSEKKLRSALRGFSSSDAICSEVDPLMGEVKTCLKFEDVNDREYEDQKEHRSTNDLPNGNSTLDSISSILDSQANEHEERSKDFEDIPLMMLQTQWKYEEMTEECCSSVHKESERNEIEKPDSKNRRKGKFPCPHCKKIFDRPYRLKRHSVLHSPTRPFPCGLCSYRFSTLSQMTKHKLIHEETTKLPSVPPPEGYQCKECPRRFEKRESLSAHIQRHRNSKQLHSFKCNLCPKKYSNVGSLTRHAEKHLRSHKISNCSRCTKPVHRNIRLTQEHNNTEESSIFDVCSCDLTFAVSHALEKLEESAEVRSGDHGSAEPDFVEHGKTEETSKEPETTENLLGKRLDNDASNSDTLRNENGARNLELSSNRIQTRRLFKAITEANAELTEIEKPNLKNRRKGRFPCPDCKKIFDRPYRLKRHATLHSPSRPFLCVYCNYRFFTITQLTKHKLIHEETAQLPQSRPAPPEGYQCNECPRRFEKRESLSAHIQSHRKHNPIHMFECDACSKKYRNISSLARHLSKHPDNQQQFRCKVCNETFRTDSQFSEHMNKHNTVEPFVCVHCNKAFSKAGKLEEHQRTHTGEKSLLCPQCGKSFHSASNMRQHLLRHSGEKRYQCPECPSRFACQSDRIKHMSTHRAVKPHVCDICGSSFTRSYSLTKHKNIHTGVRPYKCEECQMTFVFVEHMRRHKRTHTGEKPYACKFCDRAYSESGDLNKHLRSHMGEKIYKCDQCPEAFKYQQELREHQRQHFKQQKLQEEANLLDNVKEEKS